MSKDEYHNLFQIMKNTLLYAFALLLPMILQGQKKPSYTPEQALARMTLPEGFSVTQCAVGQSNARWRIKRATNSVVGQLVKMAGNDKSKFVRLYLASALQRIPLEQRWDLAEALIVHEDDKDDHNLPLLYWYGVEPLVPADRVRATKLAAKTKIPKLRQFIARRAASK